MPTLYEKCAHCHLFIVDNPSFGDAPGIAEYDHASRDDAADQAITDTHDAAPSGLIATLDTWKLYGPAEMRERFDAVTVTDSMGG